MVLERLYIWTDWSVPFLSTTLCNKCQYLTWWFQIYSSLNSGAFSPCIVIFQTKSFLFQLCILKESLHLNKIACYSYNTGSRSAVGNMSDCRSRGHKFNLGPVPFFRGDEGLMSITKESMCTMYWLLT